MDSSLVAISTLVKSNIGGKCLINFLMTQRLPKACKYLQRYLYKKENRSSWNDNIWSYQ